MKEIMVYNGNIVDREDVLISPFSDGVMYGGGFFETIKIEDRKPCYLELHIERIKDACDYFKFGFPEYDIVSLIDKLISVNELSRDVYKCKVVYLADKPRYEFFIFLDDCEMPSPKMYKDGVDVCVSKAVYNAPWAGFKSVSYYYYKYLVDAAKANGFFTAILVDENGNITEAANGNVVAVTGKKVFVPKNDGRRLPGVQEKIFIDEMIEKGYSVIYKDISPRDKNLFLLNSMIGAILVSFVS